MIYARPGNYTKPAAGAQINWAHPLTRGLTEWWTLAESGGQAYESIHSKMSSSTIAFIDPPRNGTTLGVAPIFNGSTSNYYLNNTLTPYADGTNYTVWCLCIPSLVGVTQSPIDADDQLGAMRMFQLRFQADNTYNFILFNTIVTPFTLAAGGTVVANVPTTIAGTLNGTAITVYKNGASVGTDTLTGTALCRGTLFTIGRKDNNPASNFFNGAVLAVGRWNRALSSQELLELHRNPYSVLARQSPDVSLLYNLSGTTITDLRPQSCF